MAAHNYSLQGMKEFDTLSPPSNFLLSNARGQRWHVHLNAFGALKTSLCSIVDGQYSHKVYNFMP
jgi:hypothetical protein